MYSSADSLLLSLFVVLAPAVGILIGTILYSSRIINRYSKAIARLYRASFKGADFERQRIARDLHDHLGAHSVLMSERFKSVKAQLSGDLLKNVEDLESSFNLFNYETHRIVQYMYPKGLLQPNWEKSFSLLAQQLTTNGHYVEYEIIGIKTPPDSHIHHVYWSVQEIIINAFKHANAKSIHISAVSEDRYFTISVLYKATNQVKRWLKYKNLPVANYGTLIIKDRLSIIGAKQEISIVDGYATHIIKINYENTGT